MDKDLIDDDGMSRGIAIVIIYVVAAVLVYYLWNRVAITAVNFANPITVLQSFELVLLVRTLAFVAIGKIL